jgi:galactokinase
LSPAELLGAFRAKFGAEPRLYRAPGRVNLIGEHTDYNAGLVMPAAIQFYTLVAAAARSDHRLRVHSVNFDATVEIALPADYQRAAPPQPSGHWRDYVGGVARSLGLAGYPSEGADLMIVGNVPIGSGLSSSAALEVAVGFALTDLSGAQPDLKQLALLCQRAENDYVGTRCGIMDQFAAAFGRAGFALLLDCRSLEIEPVSIGAAELVVCNTMIRHKLAAGEYNQRRRECEQGVQALARHRPAITALRDVTLDELLHQEKALDEVVFRRCRHIISENLRVTAMRDALSAADLNAAGKLMGQSHQSLRDDFEVSCDELDLMVNIATPLEGVYGARMTGGGFGGCTVNLVAPGAVEAFKAEVAARYAQATGHWPEIYVCQPADGVARIEP